MYIVIGLLGGLVEDVKLYQSKEKAIDYVETLLESYNISKESFNRDNPENYWTDKNENDIILFEVPIADET